MDRRIGTQQRRVVRAGDCDGHRLRHRDAVIVLDRDRIGLRDRLAFGQRLQCRVIVVQREMPPDRSLIVGIGQIFRNRIDSKVPNLRPCNKVRERGCRRGQRDRRRMRVSEIEVLKGNGPVRLDMSRRDRDVFLDTAGDRRRGSDNNGRCIVLARNRDRNFDNAGIRPRCGSDLNFERDGLAIIQKIELLTIERNDARVLIDVEERFQERFAHLRNSTDRTFNDGTAGDERNADIVKRRVADVRVVNLDDIHELEALGGRSKRLIRGNGQRGKLRLGVVENLVLIGRGASDRIGHCKAQLDLAQKNLLLVRVRRENDLGQIVAAGIGAELRRFRI